MCLELEDDVLTESATWWWKHVRCPACHATFDGAGLENTSVSCAACNRSFSVRDGVPDLFVAWVPDTESATRPCSEFIVSEDRVRSIASGLGLEPEEARYDPLASSVVRWRHGFLVARGVAWVLPVLAMALAMPALLGVAIALIIVDYALILWQEHREHARQLRRLLWMVEHGSLHERDLRDSGAEQAGPTEPIPGSDGRREIIDDALGEIDMQGATALCLGCGGAYDTAVGRALVDRGSRVIGLDVYDPFVQEFSAELGTAGVVADALRLPFEADCVDVACATDVLEHVHDPCRMLREIRRVLRPGGHVLVVTPNRSRARRSWDFLNPLRAAQLLLAAGLGWCAPPAELLANHAGFEFYHASFTPRQLRDMFRASGLTVRSVRIRSYRSAFGAFRRYLDHVPLLRYLNDAVLVVASVPACQVAKQSSDQS